MSCGAGPRAGTGSTHGFLTRDGCPQTRNGQTGGWRRTSSSTMSTRYSTDRNGASDWARRLGCPLRGAAQVDPRRRAARRRLARSRGGRAHGLSVPRHCCPDRAETLVRGNYVPLSTRIGSPPPSISSGRRGCSWSWRLARRRRRRCERVSKGRRRPDGWVTGKPRSSGTWIETQRRCSADLAHPGGAGRLGLCLGVSPGHDWNDTRRSPPRPSRLRTQPRRSARPPHNDPMRPEHPGARGGGTVSRCGPGPRRRLGGRVARAHGRSGKIPD